MGNTSSQQTVYENYISQQQSQLAAQQQQIDRLFQMTLNGHSRPSDVSEPHNLEHIQQLSSGYVPTNSYGETPGIPTPLIREAPKQKLNPYKILGISKKYDEKTLKRAYLKAAQKTHPDRGGSTDAFQRVSIAYTVLEKKLKDSKSNHSHTELRSHAQNFLETQNTGTNVQFDTERFDVDVFNKIYEDNRIKEVYDDGYGSWIQENAVSNDEQKPMFHDGFNKDLFNHEFEKYKVDHAQKNKHSLVRFSEPQVDISMKNKDSLMTLGQGKIEDFSGDMNGLGYRDYKDAFTNSVLTVDPNSFNLEDRQRSIGGVKKERSNISYEMNEHDRQGYERQQRESQKQESVRLHRVQENDREQFSVHDQMHKRLLNRF
jgi:curved DNA-binding protein CbpA